MSDQRTDYLGTACDLGGLSIQDFQEAFCVRCVQTECTRSLHGKSRFEARVLNWHDRLFAKVPRMDPADPRFSLIAGQRFQAIDATSSGAASAAWVDPRDLGSSSIVVPESLVAAPAAPPVEKTAEPQAAAPPIQRRFLPMNTPNQGGVMIGGAAPPPAAPAKDPWAAPTPASKSTETVIAPGSKVKLGGSGV